VDFRNGLSVEAIEGRKSFFFEKKNQKTFAHARQAEAALARNGFLVLFFNKERFPAFSKPHIPNATTIRRQVLGRIQPVKMIDRQIRDGFRRRQPYIDGYSQAAVFPLLQAAPGHNARAGRTEKDFERRIGHAGMGVGAHWPRDVDALIGVVVGPKNAIAAA
jgi:hypothetical protein